MIAFFFFFFFFSSIPHRTPHPTPSTASATCLATAATPTGSSPPSITSSSTAILGTRNRHFVRTHLSDFRGRHIRKVMAALGNSKVVSV
ncbi:hypothetical protein AAC387_Pa07g2480 [Persea americana]